MRVPAGRDEGEGEGRTGIEQSPHPSGPRSSIRNAHSIHQRSRKRLSQDTYRRNSVRFLQQRRRQARPEPQSSGSPGLSACRGRGWGGACPGRGLEDGAGPGGGARRGEGRRALGAGGVSVCSCLVEGGARGGAWRRGRA